VNKLGTSPKDFKQLQSNLKGSGKKPRKKIATKKKKIEKCFSCKKEIKSAVITSIFAPGKVFCWNCVKPMGREAEVSKNE